MRSIALILIMAAAVMAACRQGNSSHLSRSEMKAVMLDLTLAEAYCTQIKDSSHKAGTKNFDSLAVFYRRVLEHHKISEEQYRRSMDWYKDHSTELDSIYADMIPVISRWQSQYPGK